MFLITVIPLTRSKVARTLSYFTGSEMPVGAIVSVPLRSKTIFAIVTDIRPAEDMKSTIRTASFQIRKLSRVKATAFFPISFMHSCDMLADYYATHVGAIIDALVSDTLLEQSGKITPPLPRQTSFIAPAVGTLDATFAIQGDDSDRISSLRSLIRQEFARKKSIVVYVPTIDDARTTFKVLEKGIEGYIFMLHGSLPKKKITDTWTAISEMQHPVVIVATGTFSVLPRGDIEVIFIERENGRGWISPKNPYLDIRHALETIARNNKQTVYLADSLLRLETLQRLESHDIEEGSPFKWRSVSTAVDSLVIMKKQDTQQKHSQTSIDQSAETLRMENSEHAAHAASDGHTFRVISPELERLIAENRESSTHLFILTARRGMASITVCDDCETVVQCHHCHAPVVLHASAKSGKNYFMCHKCGERRPVDETCSNCGGWRLTPLGIGIDRVEEEIRARFPDIDLFRMDSDTTKSEKQISLAMDTFRARPGSILLGTDMAVAQLTEKIDHVAIASLDALFALPDFRISEKVMYTLIRLRSQATRSMLVQTRRPEEKVFEYGIKGNLSDFYRTTVDERKQFAYPPFSTLIKITLEGKKDVIATQMSGIQHLVLPFEIEVFPAFTSTLRGNSVIHGLIRLERGRWPDPELITKLRGLAASVSVKIDPESLL